ncbi:pullulanase-type alpha-1,6-glucosidase [Actinotalea sp. M2MS4P-6]|uniref:pullulanase-type alpha-1,6-glucosidase n=1 Tax=Actinotalea sp. M2MS4P-6 TaxID=2983762 RepID=UPI0021E422A9|nr:pullulanase-type alpha-1,6-glucosidase [Actinotalea sp. M2MS4P-6]MCV2395450.1 pullulanase-type alpha-1,6-glucosidase [Actinotalea sp. M2MS4P-6]
MPRTTRALAVLTTIGVAAVGALIPLSPAAAAATSVALVGDLQSELGCPGDWQPDCAATELAPTGDGTWAADFTVPAGTWEYKVAFDDAWDESYGREGGSSNAPLTLAGDTPLRFTFDEASHLIGVTPLDLTGGYTTADDALVTDPVREAGAGQQFYFVMTDRFANGDTTNDTGGLADDRLVSGFDPTDKGFYHGGDLAGLQDQLDYIEGLGTTAIWLTPSFMNKPVQGTGADASAGYHGYWITDFTQIDPHLGTNAELEALIADAHARGIKVYFDIITNHTADVISYAEGTYDYIDKATSPYTDADGVAFDPADYAGGTTFPTLDAATSFPYTPVVDPAEADVKVPAWLNDVTKYHNRGNSTYTGESSTYGDFSGLDDLMTEDPAVVQGFIDVYDGWVDLGVDGFRIDTVKHVNTEFWVQFSAAVMDHARALGNDGFFMFGEVYEGDATKTSPYVRDTELASVLDFPFQGAASAFARGFSPDTLSALFASDDLYTTTHSSATALPTFLGNHDMGRFGYLVKDDADGLARSELAHSLMFLSRGQPVVYYGDEQGFEGDGSLGGTDKDARQDMFATQVDEYANQLLLTGETAGSVDRYDTTAPLYAHIAELSALRASVPALVSGAQIERPDDADSVYAFSRVDPTEQVEHLVALNNATSDATVQVTTLTPGATFTAEYGTTGTVAAGADGVVTLTVPALSAVVLGADTTVAAPASAGDLTVSVPSAGAALTGQAAVAADVADVWQQTSFAYRVVGSDTWTALGTAETTTPRVFADVTGLSDGTLVELRAVSTGAAGQRSAASTYGSVGFAVDGVVPDSGGDGELGGLQVSVPGSYQSEVGCPGDWQPECAVTTLTHQGNGLYAGTFTIPAGSYEYKVAIGGTWDENYGAGGVPGGANIAFTLDAETQVTFVYDEVSHAVTSSAQGPLLTLPGDYQSEVGCAGDWDPTCLATTLLDVDGDGIATFTTSAIPAGTWQVKVAVGRTWDENYGADGVPGGANILFSAPRGKPITFSYDTATHLLTIEVTEPPLAGLGQWQAQWVDATTVAIPADLGSGDPATQVFALHHAADADLGVVDGAVSGGDAVELTYDPAGLSDAQLERFPALDGYLALHLPDGTDRADVASWLTGKLLVTRAESDGSLVAATGVQVPGVLDDLYADTAQQADLGATWDRRRPTLRVWAPTAQDVVLLLWPGGDTSVDPQRVAMTRSDDGTWSVTGERGWKGAAYRYEVTVYAPTTDAIEVNQVTDPYSVALTTNSTHSVLVDLDDPATRPYLWRIVRQPVVDPVDQTIYELHVRDFSINDETVPAELRGTYGAFTVNGSGMQHLRALSKAGLTTVHLLPTFDIASIEEDRSLQQTPPCDLTSFAADSAEQQACIAQVADTDGFNWGYDPYHWSTPEGSYAVDPEGASRIVEYREMVGSLHAIGLQVVADQVFNHTAASGQADQSVLDKVVPGYYQRLNAVGQVETSTCCQNVATEHLMAQKMMVDSVVLWAKEYKVDGFRFDLMGHHSVETMQAVRDALDALTVRKDGVDGSNVYLYGEGWNFGEVADNALFTQATQGQLGGTGIGTFSDRLRDAVRGGGPFDEDPRIQGFASGVYTDPNGAAVNGDEAQQLATLEHDEDLVKLGLAGNLRDFSFETSDGTVKTGAELDYNGQPAGYADSPEEVITYVDAHDNETIFDTLTLKLPTDTSMSDRVRMNTLALSTTALSQTPSFWHAGADLLRSKSLDRNSYNSGDWFNELDFTMQTNGFARGLPPEADNGAKWVYQQPLLADPALVPTSADIEQASDSAQDLLELRFSTDLFRLGSADLIEQKVSFPDGGADAVPGVIVMRIDDTVGTDVDRSLDGLVVVFNASPDTAQVSVEELAGERLTLSPVQAHGSDDVVKQTTWEASTGTASVPGRTVAVLVDPQQRGHGHGHGAPWGPCRV